MLLKEKRKLNPDHNKKKKVKTRKKIVKGEVGKKKERREGKRMEKLKA